MLIAFLFITVPLAAQTQTPADLWRNLMDGNGRYVAGHLTYDQLVDQRRNNATSQRPRVTIVSCADSRVPPELIFDKSIGDLFIVRVAGNVVDDMALGSIEFSSTPPNNWSQLIIVLGHSNCGAVRGALGYGNSDSPNLQAVLTRIRESFGIMRVISPYTNNPPSDELMRQATEANALNVVSYMRAHSTPLRMAEAAGSVEIYAAYYDLASGVVTRVLPRP
jgi:carbonic anhydrase